MKVNLLIFCFYVFICFISCNSYHQVSKDYFDANAEIEIPFFIFRSCEPTENPFDSNSSLWIKNKCDESIFDSITKSVGNYILNSSLNVFSVKFTNKILFDNTSFSLHGSHENLFKSHKKLVDKDRIKKKLNLESNNSLNLIPIITYHDAFSRTANGFYFSVRFYFTILIFEKDDLIYSSTVFRKLTHPLILKENELDKSQLCVDKMINEVVNEALQPYIERLKEV